MPTSAPTSLLLVEGLVFGWFIYDGLRQLRRGLARHRARSIFLAIAAGTISIATIGVAVGSIVLFGIGVLSGLILEIASPKLIGLTGGILPAFGLAKANRDLEAFEHRPHDVPLSAEDQAWLEGHLAGLEQWRSPETDEFIDLWRETTILQYALPPADPETLRRLNARFVSEARRVWPVRSRRA